MSTLAIIPARGGSTRIPRKNVALLGGVPLIVHTIRAALEAAEVDDVVVSTDDDEIEAVSLAHGSEVVRRPAALATAHAQTEPVLQHAVRDVEARGEKRIEVVVMLQPTSPLRGAARIDQGIRLLRQAGCDSVVGVVRDVRYYFLGDLGPGARLSVGYDLSARPRTQDIPPRHRETGALYVMTRAQIMDRGCRMGGDMRALVMEERESTDIDDPLDLALCEVLLGETATAAPGRRGPDRVHGCTMATDAERQAGLHSI